MTKLVRTIALLVLAVTQSSRANPLKKFVSRMRRLLTASNCTSGFYGLSGNCTACPDYSSSLSGSTALSDCFCLAGFANTSNQGCTPCSVGSYKELNDSSACIPCGRGTYSSTNASSSCLSCSAGKYLESTGSTTESECISCPTGQFRWNVPNRDRHDIWR